MHLGLEDDGMAPKKGEAPFIDLAVGIVTLLGYMVYYAAMAAGYIIYGAAVLGWEILSFIVQFLFPPKKGGRK